MREPISQPPFRFELGGVGAFPPRGAPRALWIGVKSGAEEVIRCSRSSRDDWQTLGVERERRPFSPHLTLARWRESRPSDRPGTSATVLPHHIARVDVNTVTLFQSRVSSAGSTYTRRNRLYRRPGGRRLMLAAADPLSALPMIDRSSHMIAAVAPQFARTIRRSRKDAHRVDRTSVGGS